MTIQVLRMLRYVGSSHWIKKGLQGRAIKGTTVTADGAITEAFLTDPFYLPLPREREAVELLLAQLKEDAVHLEVHNSSKLRDLHEELLKLRQEDRIDAIGFRRLLNILGD